MSTLNSKEKNTKGCIYILTNPSFDNYIKIGQTSDLKARLSKCNSSTYTPFSFRVFATYKVENNVKEVEQAIFGLFDAINFDLRAREDVGKSKPREREFFAIDKEKAFAVLKQVAILRGDIENLELHEPTSQERDEEQQAQVVDELSEKVKSARTTFERKGIEVGAEIVFIKNNIRATVLNGINQVEFENGQYAISTLASKLAKEHLNYKWAVNGFDFFTYNGVRIRDLNDV